MSVTIPATINGVSVTIGSNVFTSPTWGTTASSTTVNNGKISTITSKSGTQPASVDVHSASRPFSIAVFKPPVVKVLPALNANGILPNIPVNAYRVKTLKGVTPLVNQASVSNSMETIMKIAAGSDIADPANVIAMVEAHIAACYQVITDLCNSAISSEI